MPNKNDKKIVDNRLHPGCRILMNVTKHCRSLGIQLVYTAGCRTYKHNVVLDSGLLASRNEKLTSSTKPEVHNTSQRRQRSTESRPQATYIKNLVMFCRVVFESCAWADRQTDRQTDIPITILRTHPRANYQCMNKKAISATSDACMFISNCILYLYCCRLY